MSRYTVTAERSGRWWALQCVEVPGALSQVARLDQADQIRESIAFVAGVPENDVEIDLKVSVPAAAQSHIDAAEHLRRDAQHANARAAAESRAAALTLHRDAGLTLRDVGHILGVSYQRAHQLLHDVDEPLDLVDSP
jgi:hypothetical protein